ncbi:ArsR/SmtB family transcription factor [Urbifossiella limnaea]|uniref:HTH-type transcriptional regulator KmtR n=1 Tax=Urbifossiella limnaea TaxID=2528023 RepID=A0A517XL30_9BACT|nr:metalloregulator ArsR/SmtB family transcription factor [Urbifossiella limnaea]QDU18221.1 HTH-type transcriptional regulator KmtR [Urbifossiella limnaea]
MSPEVELSRANRPVPFPDAGAGNIPDRAVRDLSELFRGLGDRSRLHILCLLARHGELNVSRIGEEVGQSQPAVSHHLNQLKKAGLVEYRRDGKFNYYRLLPDGLAGLVATLFPVGAEPRLSLGSVDVVFRTG